MGQKIPINNTPQANEVWKGIGGHFDFLSQIIHEFIDNSISNFIGNNSLAKNILITFRDIGNNVEVLIEDQGTGIKDLNVAFCLGNTSIGDSPLNEHGFGMKHALASANPQNNNWAVYTRTKEDFDKNQFKKISSPYKIVDFEADLITIDEEKWPGQFNSSGTFVRFECKREMFNTLRKGIKGALPLSIDGFMAFFKEDLGFVYSNILKDGYATISIVTPKNSYVVAAVEPNWKEFIGPKSGNEDYDLGNGNVTINYQFGATNEAMYNKYYLKNQSSSGVEIRINGRLLSYNIFKDIWNLEPHPKYNHLLIKLNIISNDKSRLPTTRTSKNGIREGDGKLEKIYEWVRKKYKKPDTDEDVRDEDQDEISLFETLRDQKNTHLVGCNATTQQYVFNTVGENARIDLYMDFRNDVTIYEGKKDKTTFKDVYQLRMYWDGCVIDGINPQVGILISAVHPNSVKKLVDIVNSMKDQNGNNYNFIMKTWRDEMIPYPK
ncbi:sensor histidine kinase [Panacibacter ginsenosidivorans]|uniref:Sensor histidine kinase n=1 Tax=Panacibacter ginsenosidivorans TaxID=1813871 RepID=A0A5B8VB32_9BACT|nr:ATP-binding protein [Panacibacter ginsenosidivorans]QEC68572.1 sensor histidine kinase [Panacibacter ginsenosidivorans]